MINVGPINGMTSTAPQSMLGRSQATLSSLGEPRGLCLCTYALCENPCARRVRVQSGVLADMSFIHQAKLVTVVENTHLPGPSFGDQRHGRAIHQTHKHAHPCPICHRVPYRTPAGAPDVAELHRSTRNNENSNNSALAPGEVFGQQSLQCLSES